MAPSPLREIRRRGSSVRYLAVLLVGFALCVAYGMAGHHLPLVVAFVVMVFTIALALRRR